MEIEYREIRFDNYCPSCTHYKDDKESPVCDECLSEPRGLYSEKPINWEEPS